MKLMRQNKYVEELMRQSDYYWLNLCFISDFIGNSVLWYSVKDKYVNKDNTIDKITAKMIILNYIQDLITVNGKNCLRKK